MCYVIVTCRSITWTVLTMTSTAVITFAVVSPHWLVGPTRGSATGHPAPSATGHPDPSAANATGWTTDAADDSHRSTIGIFNRCARLTRYGDPIAGGEDGACAVYVTGFDMSTDQFPDAWKSALVLFALSLTLLAFTDVTALFSICFQAIFRKSIFTVSGLIQSLAALFVVVGQVIYPAGWSAKTVKDLCGDKAGPFLIGDCHVGWAYYTCMAGTVLLFLCALLSIQAENSTSSDKVERKIVEGKRLICVV